ncbi:MAG: InlB B-repeat-containing protein, partial [Oscillospiraceae bacterium]|nr:InlB B-repeat-containing protein [Oscillospiraceae bacterium]
GWSLTGGAGSLNADKTIYTYGEGAGTVTAGWQINSYTLTLNANGGTVTPESQTQDYATSYTLPTPTRTGYTFTGWTLTSGAGSLNAEKTVYTYGEGAGTVTAGWRANTYTVHFDANGGTGSVSDIICTYDTDASIPSNIADSITKPGNNLIGWSTDPDCAAEDVAYEEGDTLLNLTAENDVTVTLYAVWQEGIYNVYVYDDLSGTNPLQVLWGKYGTTAQLTVPVHPGYTFAGWTLSSAATDYPTTLDGNTITFGDRPANVTANWSINQYTLTIDPPSTTGTPTYVTQDYATTYTLTAPTKTGHTFAGWTLTGEGSLSEDGTVYTFGAGNGQLIPTWSVNKYTVTVIPIEGASYTVTQDYLTSYTPSYVSRPGYTFTGWSLTGKGSLSGNTYTFLDGDGTLTGHWSLNSYTLTLNANGGSVSGVSTTTCTQYYGSTYTLPEPTRQHYQFVRWTLSGSGSLSGEATAPAGNTYSNIYTYNVGDDTVYAQWTPIQYTVTLHPNNGTAEASDSAQFVYDSQETIGGSELELRNWSAKAGCHFLGWAAAADADAVQYPADTALQVFVDDGVSELYAVWEEHTYGAWEETTAPTCTEAGVETHTCTHGDGAAETRTGADALGHTYSIKQNTVAPTHTATGYTTYTCVRCDATENRDETPKTAAHTFGEWVETTAPTCTEAGVETRTCTVADCGFDGASESRPVTALGHAYTVKQNTVAPTHTATGYTTYKCVRCDATENRDETPKTSAHTFGEWVETTAPTCTEAGVETRTCTVADCGFAGAIETRTGAAALGHSFTVFVQTVDPTVSAGGYTVYRCSRCTQTEQRDRSDPIPTYQLTVNSGQGSGRYPAGQVVTITAAAPPTGKLFDCWTGATVTNAAAATTTLTMPAANTAVTATYKDDPAVLLANARATRIAQIRAVTNGLTQAQYTSASWQALQTAINTAVSQVNAAQSVAAVNAVAIPNAAGILVADPEYNCHNIHLWGKHTKYESNFINWLLVIICFGWIWMTF